MRADGALFHGFVLVAPPRTGKTTAILHLARTLRAEGVQVGGVAQPALLQAGRPVAYHLEDLATGTCRDLATRRVRTGPGLGFHFDPSAFSWAAARISGSPDPTAGSRVVLVDELGWLEAEGGGHLPAVRQLLCTGGARALVLAVRQEVWPAVRDALDLRGAHGGPSRLQLPPDPGAHMSIRPILEVLK